MHDGGIAGMEFEAVHVARRRDGQRKHERPGKNRHRRRAPRPRLRQRDDEIRRPQLPACGPRRCRGQVGRVACRRAARGPKPDQFDLPIREVRLADEIAGARIRFPGRHQVGAGDTCDERRARPHGVVADEAERPGPVRMMAAGASRVQDRRDVFRERHLLANRGLTAVTGGNSRREHRSAGQQAGGSKKPYHARVSVLRRSDDPQTIS